MVSNRYEFDIPQWPVYGDEEMQYLSEVITSGFWAGSRAKYSKEVSKNFLNLHNGTFGFPVTNGTTTLETALKVLGVKAGDEVILPALTFFSSVSAVLRTNANPVIVDIDRETFCISTSEVKHALSEKTKAIIPVHLSGAMCDMDELMKIAASYRLNVIEDCAHAHGSEWNHAGAGTIGDFGSFSFQHSKLISCGEGGFLIANSQENMDKAWNFSNCGRSSKHSVYEHSVIGTNNRISDFQAAVLNAQILRYESQLKIRERNASFLRAELSRIEGVSTQIYDNRMTRRAYYNFIIVIDPHRYGKHCCRKLLDIFTQAGVPTSLPYPPLNELEIFRNKNNHELLGYNVRLFETPNAKYISENSIWLHHRLLLSDKETITKFVYLFFKSLGVD